MHVFLIIYTSNSPLFTTQLSLLHNFITTLQLLTKKIMELKPGMSALVTGGANGIGRAISLALAKKGLFVTILDFSEQKGNETAPLIEAENQRFHPDVTFPTVTFIKCDVTNPVELSSAYAKHVETYGGLDVSVHSAGVGVTDTSFDEDETDGINSWRRIININFTALVDCTRIAIQTMRKLKKPGAVMNMGSAAGLYPAPTDPIYSASKGGVVLFTRSCALLAREGIRVNALCPEFVNTDAIYEKNLPDVKMVGGFLPMETIVQGALELITNETKAGACLWITNRRGMEYWPSPEEEKKIFGDLNPQKWRCKAHAELPKTKPEEAWALVKDYFNIHKIMPALSTCEKVEGTNGELGCVRYCAGVMHPSELQFWARERMVALDEAKMSYSYYIFECSSGVEDYIGTMQVLKGGEGNGDGCRFEWSMECKPLDGFTESGYAVILQNWTTDIAKRIEEICNA